jgi:hypothetical protein
VSQARAGTPFRGFHAAQPDESLTGDIAKTLTLDYV